MSNHTPEPWGIKENTPTIRDSRGIAILRCESGAIITENDKANASRIVACVNACAGLPDDALDGGWSAVGLSAYAKRLEADLAAVTAQRDELLQAMRQIAFATAPEPDDGSEHENAYSLAMGAIEKCGVQP